MPHGGCVVSIGKKERDLLKDKWLTQDDVRKDGKGRIRILIGKILVAKERREGSSKFWKRVACKPPFFIYISRLGY